MASATQKNIMVRPIKASDKSRWLEHWQGYLTFYKTSVPAEQTERTWNRIMDPDFNMYCAVAEIDGDVVGFTTYNLQNSTWSPHGHCYFGSISFYGIWPYSDGRSLVCRMDVVQTNPAQLAQATARMVAEGMFMGCSFCDI